MFSAMEAVWEFRSVKPRNPQDRFHILGRFPIRRACPFIGTESEALAFARRACEHLKSKNVVRVEAWSSTGSAEPASGAVTFRIRPHENGRDWRVVEDSLQHALWVAELDHGLHYMLRRGSGKLCRIEVLNSTGGVAWLVLVDQRGDDPYAGKGPTWSPQLETS
jgi:hypothetical protein